jgi:ATP-dependent DNA helicase RecQ
VRADIVRCLHLQQPEVRVAGFDRPNLHLEVHRLRTDAEKKDSLVAAVRESGPAIVYSATRKQTEAMARHLAQHGVAAAAYHAGLETSERRRVQERFAGNAVRVVAATNAFGLGVDKADVRLVVHTEIPRSLESYYQEVGRAGRDGRPATGALFFAERDLVLQRCLLGWANPRANAVRSAWDALVGAGRPLAHEDLVARVRTPSRMEALAAIAFLESSNLLVRARGQGPVRLRVCGAPGAPGSEKAAIARLLGARQGETDEAALSQALGAADRTALRARLEALEKAGEIRRLRASETSLCTPVAGAVLDEEDLRRLRVRTMREQARFAQMQAFARTDDCRRRVLLRALGEEYAAASCGACDVCTGAHLQPVRSQLPLPVRLVRGLRGKTGKKPVQTGLDVDHVPPAC